MDSDSALTLVRRLRGLASDLDQFGASFAERNGLHVTDLRALIVLLDADRGAVAATPGWLGAQLGLGSAATTALIDRLERAGHLTRTADPADRRRVLLRVQEQARYLGWSYFGPLVGRLVAPIRGFDADELATVERFLSVMNEAVRDGGRGADAERAGQERSLRSDRAGQERSLRSDRAGQERSLRSDRDKLVR
ncbi:MarR family winged helix-turn-helix transcriptional regulator [Rhodococcus sp. NPDC059234]|uniref:MarR family winged helix-turn-helix transcriptional regulator n=1 Tax=Rhodococcus sp. NPDC059234 TaxID=3346781 RepID=UPI00366A71CF